MVLSKYKINENKVILILNQQNPKVAIYNRTSTFYQEDTHSERREELIEYCRNSLNIPEFVIFDEVCNFDREVDRPAYQEMMRRLRQKEFTHLLVWKMDNLLHDYEAKQELLEELENCKVLLVNYSEIEQESSAQKAETPVQ